MRPYRSELKFLTHFGVREMLLRRWGRYLVRAPYMNEYGSTSILSQYYDSPDLLFYREKLDGVATRRKVRIRTYGLEFSRGSTTFLEIKSRYNDRVQKRRYRFAEFDPSHLDPTNWAFDDLETEAGFLFLRDRHRLRPSVQVYYQREAYQAVVDREVRVTFDSCLVGLHPGEKLTEHALLDRTRNLLPDTLVIMEIKSTGPLPPWVHDGIIAGELQQKTLSKYVAALDHLGLDEMAKAGGTA